MSPQELSEHPLDVYHCRFTSSVSPLIRASILGGKSDHNSTLETEKLRFAGLGNFARFCMSPQPSPLGHTLLPLSS